MTHLFFIKQNLVLLIFKNCSKSIILLVALAKIDTQVTVNSVANSFAVAYKTLM